MLEDQWAVNGVHYSKTLEAWLTLFDQKYMSDIKPIFEATYGNILVSLLLVIIPYSLVKSWEPDILNIQISEITQNIVENPVRL